MKPEFSYKNDAPRPISGRTNDFRKNDLASAIFLSILNAKEKIGVKP
jgi:hypothetical protein